MCIVSNSSLTCVEINSLKGLTQASTPDNTVSPPFVKDGMMMNANNTSASAPMEVDMIPSASSHSSLASNPIESYTDDDHNQMDEAVNHTLIQYGKLLAPFRGPDIPFVLVLPYVLQEVICGNNQLDQLNLDNHRAAIGLIEKYPILKSKLEDAWQSESYCNVCELGTHVNHQ